MSLLQVSRAFSAGPAAFIKSNARLLSTKTGATANPCEEKDMPFYALGHNVGKQISTQFSALIDPTSTEMDALILGVTQTLKRQDLPLPGPELMQKYGPPLNDILQARSKEISSKMQQQGIDYLEAYLKDNTGAIKTESGLVFHETNKGSGAHPTERATVEVHYHGSLPSGTVFDSSVERGQTISFPIPNVIKGWQEAIQLMAVGSKATIIIPSELGYGDAGSGETIPPGSTLRFEVELFKITEA